MVSLVFGQTHASITSFPTAQLPDFTLITGPNGAGKSHLLQAIHRGFIRTDAAPEQNPHNQNQIRIFDWSTLVPQDSGHFSSESIRGERQNLYDQYSNLRNANGWLEPARSVIRNFNIGGAFLSEPSLILSLAPEAIDDLTGSPEQSASLIAQINSAFQSFDSQLMNHLDQNAQAQLRAVSVFSRRPLVALTDKDILSPAIPTWGQNDLFQQSFARLFVAYRDLKLANIIAQFRSSKGEVAYFLSDDEFLEKHGPAPWDFVNESLADANLDFEINQPNPDDYTTFSPNLTKRSTGVAIPFSNLSSGEKVLMSFAFCVYYSNDRRQLQVQPKMLLLDEIDAPLHPSMSKNVINTITKTLVEKFGIKIIATTHSPSTVALAPEDSIFTMRPGEPGLHKSSKAAALNILTVGVPTISMSFDGRRQVFVESPTDARVYDALYKVLKPKIDSERSIEFIATGTRISGKGDLNTGCDVVKRLVDSLATAGNMSVYGLIDWDGVHESSDRIVVLAEGVRNGLENVLLDPLLIGIAICRSLPEQKQAIGLASDVGYLDLVTGPIDRFGSIAQAVTEAVFGPPLETVPVSYCGGLVLQLDRRYLEVDDHRLESLLLEKMPFLRAITRGQSSKLLEHIVTHVLADMPDLIPSEIRVVIEDILNRQSHIDA